MSTGPAPDIGSDDDDGWLRDDERPCVIPITGELDLHAFAPRDVAGVVRDYIEACRAAGLAQVRLVHGRGRGVQRAQVRRLLASLPGVAMACDAPPQSGGWGATWVQLDGACVNAATSRDEEKK